MDHTVTDPAAPTTPAMDLAFDLAARGPKADANPRVGCVVTDATGAIVGTGFHRGAGTPHAEVVALAEAGERARGGTAYVTLEPCAHTGRTGPCADALLAAGVAAVVYADADPGAASGGGAQRLREAGVDVGHRPDPRAAELNPYWRHALTRGRPFVTWKFAATLDGRLAAADGTSRWITSTDARADVHRLRAEAGAVVTGTGTVLADDPHLTVRHDGRPIDRQPLRVVVGDRDIPADARIRDDAADTITLARADPRHVLAHLHDREIRHVLLECGPTLGAAFLRAGVVDEVVAYLAPALLGAGAPAVGELGISTIADIIRLDLRDVARLGPDVRLTLTVQPPQEAS